MRKIPVTTDHQGAAWLLQEHLVEEKAEVGPEGFKSYVCLRVSSTAAKDLVVFECLQGIWAPYWGCCMSVVKGKKKVGLGVSNLHGRYPGRKGKKKNKMGKCKGKWRELLAL